MTFNIFIRNEKGNLYNNFVTNFRMLYPTMGEILVNQYNLLDSTKILIHHTKIMDRPGFPGYRTPYKKFLFGTIEEFKSFLLDYYRKNIWNREPAEAKIEAIIKKARLFYVTEYYALQKTNKENRAKYTTESIKEYVTKDTNGFTQLLQEYILKTKSKNCPKGRLPNNKELQRMIQFHESPKKSGYNKIVEKADSRDQSMIQKLRGGKHDKKP